MKPQNSITRTRLMRFSKTALVEMMLIDLEYIEKLRKENTSLHERLMRADRGGIPAGLLLGPGE